VDPSARKQAEIDQGLRIASQAEAVWQRDTVAGEKRLDNRLTDMESFFGKAPVGKLLEIGCGTGVWTRRLVREGLDITSMDISDALLSVARQKVPKGAQFLKGDIEALPFKEQEFDFVCGLSILHHLDIRRAISEIYRVLKPHGKVWFSEPNMLNPQIMVQKNVPVIKRWMQDTPYETAFFRWPLRRHFERAGFHDVAVVPIDFLHPQIPAFATAFVNRAGKILERLPGVREFGGSLLLHAEK
jgi:SAM-dependent methyltransferase